MKAKHLIALAASMMLALTACGAAPEQPAQTETPAETTAADTAAAETEAQADTETQTDAETEAAEEETTAAPEADGEPAEYSIASLKGPTTMGMVKLMNDSENGATFNKYNVEMFGAADEIVAGVASGNTDIANVPANLAAVLYKKTDGAVKVCDVNTLGVLYVVTTGETISSVEDLRGKTVYSTGKGTTPEYVFNYILRQNGLEPQTDVTIEYKTEAAECAAAIAESENGIAVLPQPYVTAAMTQNENISIALSLTDEWNKVSETPLITGVTIAQGNVIEENTYAFDMFLSEYAASVEYVNANTDEAAALIGGYDIVKEPVAKKALPFCNITLLRDKEMIDAVKGYWNVLFSADPTAVGGAVPEDSVFYTNAE